MKNVKIYSTEHCPYCVRAKALLTKKKVAFEDIRVDLDPALRQEMERLSGRRTVPQIFIGEQHIGGCDDLFALNQKGELDPLIEALHSKE